MCRGKAAFGNEGPTADSGPSVWEFIQGWEGETQAHGGATRGFTLWSATVPAASLEPMLRPLLDEHTWKTFATVFVLGAVFLASLPWWLPRYVIKLRMAIFTRINGDSGLLLI